MKKVNKSDVFDKKVPIWKKYYELSNRLIEQIDNRWSVSKRDFVVKFTFMDEYSYISINCYNNVSYQFFVTFGSYSGEQLMLPNSQNKFFKPNNSLYNIIKFDESKKHYVTKFTSGIRYSFVLKIFDRRYK